MSHWFYQISQEIWKLKRCRIVMWENERWCSTKPHLRRMVVWFIFISVPALAQSPPTQETPAPEKTQAHVFAKDLPIYVSDFELQTEDVQADRSLVGGGTRQGILPRPLRRPQDDPQTHARNLVVLMSSSIIADLRKAGYNALPLSVADPRPQSGKWVHGVFTEVDEGNRLHRAVIGFGSGQAKMNLFVSITDLANLEKPLYEASLGGPSGKSPGAIITLNPYVAAAKFVLGKNATDNMVKKTAAEVSKQIVMQLSQHEAALANH